MSGVALGYGRKSVVRTKSDEISVDKQRLAVERLCAERGYALEWYADAEGHRSGRFEKTRPNYLRLLSRLENGPAVQAVIFYELDRAGRSVVIIDRIVKVCQARGVALISIVDGIDTARGIDANMTSQIQVRAVFSEWYANYVSDKMRSTSAFYRDELLSPWGMWPFGMTRTGEGKDARFAPHPKHGATAKTILTWYASGLSYDAVAQAANDKQLRHEDRHRQAKRFTREAIRSIVGNVLFYCGYVVTGKRFRSKDNRIILEGEGTYLERNARAMKAQRSPVIEPLIDEAMACTLIERRYKNQQAGRRPSDWVALLTPLAYWQGRKMRADTKDGWHYYHPRIAGPWIDGDQADREIVELLAGVTFPLDLREAIRASVAARVGDTTKKKAAADVADYTRRLAVLADLLLDEAIQREEYDRRYVELERALHAARQELVREDDVDRLMAGLSDLAGAIQLMRDVNRKRALGHLFERIDLADDGSVSRLYLKAWAKAAWGEIVFAYRLYANQSSMPTVPPVSVEHDVGIPNKGVAWLVERTG